MVTKAPHLYDYEFILEYLDTSVEPAFWQAFAMRQTETAALHRYDDAIRNSNDTIRVINRFTKATIISNEGKPV